MSAILPSNISSRPVAVVGAGTLGRRIALMFATQGGQVRIFDTAAAARASAVAYVEQQLPSVIETVVIGGTAGTVLASDDLAGALKGAWLVVEAVPELLDVKKQMFGQLDALADQDAILASNSSSYPTRTFLDNVIHPERVLNLHFYMPPTQNAGDVIIRRASGLSSTGSGPPSSASRSPLSRKESRRRRTSMRCGRSTWAPSLVRFA